MECSSQLPSATYHKYVMQLVLNLIPRQGNEIQRLDLYTAPFEHIFLFIFYFFAQVAMIRKITTMFLEFQEMQAKRRLRKLTMRWGYVLERD